MATLGNWSRRGIASAGASGAVAPASEPPTRRPVSELEAENKAGERLFVDYAGQTVEFMDMFSGEITRAQIFVAVLGASNLTYACATRTQQAEDWVRSIIAALQFIGGVPRLLVHDQPRALMARPDRYEPTAHRLLAELGEHYGVAILPARPAHPKDKAKVEVGVQVMERWILARLRGRRFINLAELNRAIAPLLTQLNERPFKKLPGCRRSAFEQMERAALSPLPATPMQVARFKLARVNIDYHVEYEGHYYSVPRTAWSASRWSCASRPRRWRRCTRPSGLPPTCSMAGAGATAPRPSPCPPRTARTPSGARPSSWPGARASERPVRPWCAGSWSTARTPSRATAPAWA